MDLKALDDKALAGTPRLRELRSLRADTPFTILIPVSSDRLSSTFHALSLDHSSQSRRQTSQVGATKLVSPSQAGPWACDLGISWMLRGPPFHQHALFKHASVNEQHPRWSNRPGFLMQAKLTPWSASVGKR